VIGMVAVLLTDDRDPTTVIAWLLVVVLVPVYQAYDEFTSEAKMSLASTSAGKLATMSERGEALLCCPLGASPPIPRGPTSSRRCWRT
jgi:hypothetical protein